MGSKAVPAPLQFVKGLLGKQVVTRSQIVAALKKEGYSKHTIQGQMYQLRHWPGAIFHEEGFSMNADFKEAAKAEKKPAKKAKSKPQKSTLRAVPKPSAKKKAKTQRVAPPVPVEPEIEETEEAEDLPADVTAAATEGVEEAVVNQ